MGIVETITPKVSVVITCFNHGHFLGEAIRSVLRQTYQPIEIVVVDDGSTDNTSAVAASFPAVKYVYQKNAGLSAARNTGVTESIGKYLVFLDADDWLYDEAIAINLNFLKRHKNCVFVSGDHHKVDRWKNVIPGDAARHVEKNHFVELLRGNYIGMHATVMYHRIVFSEFQFDTTLQACEDYDLYLRVAKKYHVCSHDHKIAAYRIHDTNMSKDIPMMVSNIERVLARQKPELTKKELEAVEEGLHSWRLYYANKLFERVKENYKQNGALPVEREFRFLLRHTPVKILKYVARHTGARLKAAAKSNFPDVVLKVLHKAGLYTNYAPGVGKVNKGDFERLTPLSNDFGFDRGGAIDRFYIEEFIEDNRDVIKGKVLEIGDNEYTLRFGRSLVQQSEILHVDASNSKATYVGDITNVPQIPSEIFDCIILTQTLHLIYDFKSALKSCYRILKPGGTLLMTVPGISHIDKGPWKDYWLWSFTDASITKVMNETFNGSEVEVKSFGNVQVASAFLYGMGLPEISVKTLRYNDPSYQVIITVKAIKH